MSYSKQVDFRRKDGLNSGDPEKLVRGFEIDDELTAIEAAFPTKLNITNPTFTGVMTGGKFVGEIDGGTY